MNATTDHSTIGRGSVAALVTYWLLAVWTLMVAGVFTMVLLRLSIEGVLLGVLAGVIGTQTTLTVGAVGFWVGSSQGAKAATDRAAKAEAKSEALEAEAASPPKPD